MPEVAGSSSRNRGHAEKRAAALVLGPDQDDDPEPQTSSGALGALPDALLGNVFDSLGLPASWPLRRVCRRWRRVIEEIQWAAFELRIRPRRGIADVLRAAREACPGAPQRQLAASASEAPEQSSDRVCGASAAAASALFEQRKLRLGGGASVAVRLELEPDSKDGAQQLLEEAHGLLAAVARGCSGGAGGPREVTVELLLAGEGGGGEGGEGFLRASLLGALRALRPPGGRPCAAAWRASAWPAPDELRAALAPFAGLRSLCLCFPPDDPGAGPGAAAAIAGACPLLRDLCLSADFDEIAEVAAALAALAGLERLCLAWPGSNGLFDVTGALAALADGPAGPALRSLEFLPQAGLHREGEFPARQAADEEAEGPGSQPLAIVGDAAFAALGRMPRLESLGPLCVDPDQLEPEAVVALGGARGLREASLVFTGSADPDREAAVPRALAAALSALPRLHRLALDINCFCAGAADVLALLECEAARRALARLELSLDRPLEEAEAAALVALPALRRLALACSLDGPAPDPLRPFQVLRGLRPEVNVRVDLGGGGGMGAEQLEEAEASVRRMLAGRARPEAPRAT
eukprot:tig00021135_g18958.t1